MGNYKKTKAIKGQSPLLTLKQDDLKTLAAWEGSDIYNILSDVIADGMLKEVRNLIVGGDFNKDMLLTLAEQRGRYKALQEILRLPTTAQKILEASNKK